jgi:hypothetical protein
MLGPPYLQNDLQNGNHHDASYTQNMCINEELPFISKRIRKDALHIKAKNCKRRSLQPKKFLATRKKTPCFKEETPRTTFTTDL